MSDFNENSDQPKFPLNTNNTQNNNLQSLDDLIIYNADLMNTNIDISNPNNENNENTLTQNYHSKISEAEPIKKILNKHQLLFRFHYLKIMIHQYFQTKIL